MGAGASRYDIRSALKQSVLYGLKLCGGFAIARVLTRRSLRILCYHGISMSDEHVFRRRLFMQTETFRKRMEHLVTSRYVVLPLSEALQRLQDGTLPGSSVAITIDDGWLGCLEGAFPALRELELPATLYVTTYYVFRRTYVFDVMVGYLLWKTKAESLELDGLWEGLEGTLQLSSPSGREEAADRIVEHGNERLTCAERIELARRLAARLGLDHDALEKKGLFRLVEPEDLRRLSAEGLDLELHTHRHELDVEDRERTEREIRDNRERLAAIAGRRLEHFCYPSGVYHPRVWPWLEHLGIRSATTTDVGLCTSRTPRYALPRIVDGENISAIEFEAEVAGALELYRRARAWLRRAASRQGDANR